MNKILDLGCGAKKIEIDNSEVIGLDFYDKTSADIFCNLEKGKLPFKDNEFDGIFSSHTLEHIRNLLPIIDEMWRVVKPGGIIKLHLPYFASSFAHSSIDHVRFFSYTSFYPYRKECPTHYRWHPTTFKVKSKYIFSGHYGLRTIGKVIGFIINKIPRIYQRLFCFILPSEEIHLELEVVKEKKTMNEELCIKCLEDLDVVMCNNWFPFELTAEEVAKYPVDRLGDKGEQK